MYTRRHSTDNSGAAAEVAQSNENDLKQETGVETSVESPADVPSGDAPAPPAEGEGSDAGAEAPAGE